MFYSLFLSLLNAALCSCRISWEFDKLFDNNDTIISLHLLTTRPCLTAENPGRSSAPQNPKYLQTNKKIVIEQGMNLHSTEMIRNLFRQDWIQNMTALPGLKLLIRVWTRISWLWHQHNITVCNQSMATKINRQNLLIVKFIAAIKTHT